MASYILFIMYLFDKIVAFICTAFGFLPQGILDAFFLL